MVCSKTRTPQNPSATPTVSYPFGMRAHTGSAPEIASAAEHRAPTAALLAWFARHRRDLPWRRTRNPYAIWVSEIMLQQTRVAAVLDHYARWMVRFPTIESLAAAAESEVLALWSGLGYYRRARFLHAGAKGVVAEHGGQLPRTAAALRLLPGIGEYTSAAIASIAFGEPVAVVDGNVERVVMRLAGLGSLPAPALDASEAAAGSALRDPTQEVPLSVAKKSQGAPQPTKMSLAKCGFAGPGALQEHPIVPQLLPAARLARAIRTVAHDLLDPDCPGDTNQAMMELGATVCLPRAPLCLHCPLQPWCRTRGEHPASPRQAMLTRSITYGLLKRERAGHTEVLLTQRPASASLMAGMWELPPLAEAGEIKDAEPLLTLRHAITVTNFKVTILSLDPVAPVATALMAHQDARWFSTEELQQTALTGLARKALKRLALWPATTPGHLQSPSIEASGF